LLASSDPKPDPKPDAGLSNAAYDEGTPRSVIFGMMLLGIGTALAFLVVALSLIPFIKQWFARDVTLTVETETQSVAWRAQPTADEPLILPLPAGKVMQQKVGEDFSVSMVGTPLSVPAIRADSEVELRMISRGPCDFDLTARAANDKKIAVFDGGVERPDLAASEVIYVLRDRSNPVELAAPCTDETARYDFLLNRAVTLDVGEGVPAAEVPTRLVASTPTVLSGAVSAHNRAWLFDTRYDLGANTINPGDFVRLVPESSRGAGYQLAISGAVSFAPSKGALDVVAYASSAQAEVEHFGGRYVFTATTWETIASQPVVQFFFSALAAMLAIVGFVMGIKKWRRQGMDGLDASIH
jgi:hypothetical protein